MKSALRFPRGLYGITPEWDDTPRLLAALEAAAAGGMVALQWRRKNISPGDRLPQALAAARRCRELNVVFIVNDDWRLAAQVDADGVHLGREDGSIEAARRALGPGKIIGRSCYNQPGLAQSALQAGADYIAFGAMYPSANKPDAVRATLDHIRQGRFLAQAQRPGLRAAVVAIGGLTADYAGVVVQAGADSIALINGLFEADDIRAAALQCQALFF
jgi:thiamine-phosphate pyrophosphorylase